MHQLVKKKNFDNYQDARYAWYARYARYAQYARYARYARKKSTCFWYSLYPLYLVCISVYYQCLQYVIERTYISGSHYRPILCPLHD